MSDRRRTPRYVLGNPLVGDAMPMQDVIVESLSGDRLVVISQSAPPVTARTLARLPADATDGVGLPTSVAPSTHDRSGTRHRRSR